MYKFVENVCCSIIYIQSSPKRCALLKFKNQSKKFRTLKDFVRFHIYAKIFTSLVLCSNIWSLFPLYNGNFAKASITHFFYPKRPKKNSFLFSISSRLAIISIAMIVHLSLHFLTSILTLHCVYKFHSAADLNCGFTAHFYSHYNFLSPYYTDRTQRSGKRD